jgi:hypothetical protein
MALLLYSTTLYIIAQRTTAPYFAFICKHSKDQQNKHFHSWPIMLYIKCNFSRLVSELLEYVVFSCRVSPTCVQLQ